MTSTVSLGEICQFVGGGTPSRKIPHYWNGCIPWATVKDFAADRISHTSEFISEEGLIHSASKVVPSGTVLLVTRVGLGKVAISGVDLAINQDIKAIFPSDEVLPEFLFWSLKYLGPEIENKGLGATVKGVTLKDVKDLEIPLLPLTKQRRIVNILNRAAEIERLRKQAQERLREFIPALFIKMFGDPVENPMGWEEALIGDLGAVDSGAGFPKKEQGIQGDEIPFLKVGDMNLPGNEITIQSWNNTISDTTRERLRAKLFPVGSVIFPKIGAAIATNKKRILTCPSCVDNNVMAIVSDITRIHSEYLYGLILHKDLGDFASASDPPSMRKMTVENWCIPIPPLSMQSQYAEIVESARASIMCAFSANKTAESLNSSLMSGLLKADT